MAVVAILQPDARAIARLSGALNGVHEVVVHRSWESLEVSLEEAHVEACVIDGEHPDRRRAFDRITELRARHPGPAIIAFVESDHAEGFFDLGSVGVDGVLFASSSTSRVKNNVDDALTTSRARNVSRLLEVRIPEPGPAAVAWAIEHAGCDVSVERLAAALGYSAGGLRDHLQDRGLPPPSRLLLWGRLILAGARLVNDRRHVEDVAFSLGYSTASSLARAMKVHTGLTPSEVSRGGGLSQVVNALFPPEPQRRGGRGRGTPSRIASAGVILFLIGYATLGAGSPALEGGAIHAAHDTTPMEHTHMGVFAMRGPTG